MLPITGVRMKRLYLMSIVSLCFVISLIITVRTHQRVVSVGETNCKRCHNEQKSSNSTTAYHGTFQETRRDTDKFGVTLSVAEQR
jgi:hypothetical protein